VEDAIKNGEIHLVVNTGLGGGARRDGYVIRRAALKYSVPYVTTTSGGLAVCRAIAALKSNTMTVQSLQAYHADTNTWTAPDPVT
jgi:carbamoyl-phosphate synthase large subunit